MSNVTKVGSLIIHLILSYMIIKEFVPMASAQHGLRKSKASHPRFLSKCTIIQLQV